MALATTVSLRLYATLTGTAADLATAPVSVVDSSNTLSLTTGTGANQADKIWSDTRTVTTGATDTLDFAGTALDDPFGADFVPAKIKSILIVAAAANTTDLTVSRPASNGVPFLAAASDAFVLKPGGAFLLHNQSAAGIAVTAGTGDLIDITNSAGASANYNIVVVGTSA
jgi:hypothetical protein